MITITPTALQEIQRIQKSHQKQDSYFRISVANGGCSGLIYAFNLDKNIKDNDNISNYQGLKIVIDQDSLVYLKNLKLDYSEDLMGGGFRFQNPQANKHCNCGQSFAMKT
jgi:iron-sulfur cluster assembly accessory protein